MPIKFFFKFQRKLVRWKFYNNWEHNTGNFLDFIFLLLISLTLRSNNRTIENSTKYKIFLASENFYILHLSLFHASQIWQLD